MRTTLTATATMARMAALKATTRRFSTVRKRGATMAKTAASRTMKAVTPRTRKRSACSARRDDSRRWLLVTAAEVMPRGSPWMTPPRS